MANQKGSGRSGMIWQYSSATVQKVPLGGALNLGVDDIKHEISIYEKLGQHPGILKYFGPKGSGLLLEYHQRGCLRGVLQSGAKVPFIKWAKQIAEAVDYMHRKGIVHCDLNARNILITDESDAVLADFGNCSIDGQQELGICYDVSCSRPGQDESHYASIDDIFALGSIIYELCTGIEPYNEKTEEEIAQLYKKGEFLNTSHLEMENIINKCWQAKYEDAAEVLKDISGCIQSSEC
jgi:serine/threonine protein kinase